MQVVVAVEVDRLSDERIARREHPVDLVRQGCLVPVGDPRERAIAERQLPAPNTALVDVCPARPRPARPVCPANAVERRRSGRSVARLRWQRSLAGQLRQALPAARAHVEHRAHGCGAAGELPLVAPRRPPQHRPGYQPREKSHPENGALRASLTSSSNVATRPSFAQPPRAVSCPPRARETAQARRR